MTLYQNFLNGSAPLDKMATRAKKVKKKNKKKQKKKNKKTLNDVSSQANGLILK